MSPTSAGENLDPTIRASILQAVDDLEPALVALVQDLVRIPSVTGSEGAVQRRVAAEMRDMGLDVDVWEPDVAELAPYEEGVGRPESGSYADRPVVVGTRRGTGDGRSLILNGHIDVVDPTDPSRWEHGPWSGDLVDGEIWGRGSVDMKGGVATILIVARAIAAAGITLRGNLIVESVISEEDGGAGTVAAILRPYLADVAIVTEPTSLRLVAATGGSFVFRITLTGRAAHAAYRDEGVSAIELWTWLHPGLMAYEERRNAEITHPLYQDVGNKVPLNFGVIRGGVWPSSVADELIVEGRGGLVAGESLDEIRAGFVAEIERLSQGHEWLRDHPPKVEWFSGQFTAGEIATDNPLVEMMSRAHQEVNGDELNIAAMQAGADSRHFVQMENIPAALYGGGDVRLAHQTDERVNVDELLAASRVLALVAAEWCGVADQMTPDRRS